MAKANSKLTNGLRIPAVGYIRMSTGRQEHSPERQRKEIEILADREGYRIIKWYEDHGLTGTESANRPEFQQLLRDAQSGRFEAILLYEQSRFSREDIFDVMLHWRLLREAGVDIVTCQRGRLCFDDLGGILTAIIDQHGAREESVKLAARVVSGQRMRASQGKRIGGTVFGYDRNYYDEKGDLIRRVHFRENFKKPPTWRSEMIPSNDVDAVESLQWAFEAIRDGHSIGHVTNGLNDRGMTTTYGNKFSFSATKGMLQNPAYAGILRVGKYSHGKFCQIADQGLIVVEDAHDALVPREVFDDVQAILKRRKGHHERSAPGTYLLGALVKCMHCGFNMYGARRKSRKESTPNSFYQCPPSGMMSQYDPDCPHPAVRVDRLEVAVLKAIREHVLQSGVSDRIKDAIVRAKSKNTKKATNDEKRLIAVRQKIERGTENLALASREDFAAISKLVMKWREEEAELADRIERRHSEIEPLPEALDVISRCSEISDQLDLADRVKLAHAVKQTVVSVTIGARQVTTGIIEHREYFGEMLLHETICKKPIEISDREIGYRKIWREIADLAREAGRPLHLADFAKHIGTKDMSRASHNVRRAVASGLIRKIGSYGGWVAVE